VTRRLVVAGVAGLVGLVLALPAMANHTSQHDPNDTDGRLDLRTVRFDHERPLVWTFITIAEWRPRQIFDRGYFVVELDTRDDEAIDYFIVLRSTGREMAATLHRIQGDGTQAEIATLDSGKDGGRSAWVALALRRIVIGARRTSYFWAATSLYTGEPCRRTCFDRAPDDGMVDQPLEEPSPSPSPSPSPTPSPTPTPSPSA
jgi:hypothetical protein